MYELQPEFVLVDTYQMVCKRISYMQHLGCADSQT